MTKISDALTYGLTLRESATDGSDFTNPAADYRRLFLGEDGSLHLRDSAGTVTATGGGGGALVLLEQHTASNSATLDFTTCITSTYDAYRIELINLLPATNNANLKMRCSIDGGANYDAGNNYAWRGCYWGSYGDEGDVGNSVADASMGPFGNPSNAAAGGGISGTVRLYSPLSATAHKAITFRTYYCYLITGGYYYTADGFGTYISTTAVDAFRFFFSAGNIASGTIRVYGLAKA